MILLVGSIVVALLIGGLIGYIIGSHSAKAISQSIEGVKDKVDQVHTKAESIKDDLIAIEGIANTIKDATPDSVKDVVKEETSKVGDDITNFVENEVKELDAVTDSKEDAVASEASASTDDTKTETAVAGDGTVAKTGIVAG